MTHKIRDKINQYRKKHIDISDIIRNVDIKGEDLSHCFITDLQVCDTDISGCNFSGSTLKIDAKNANARECLFIGAKLLDGSSLRGCDLRNTNFKNADCGYIDYSYSDLRGANICGIKVSLGSRLGMRAKISENIIEMLRKYWDVHPNTG